MIYATVTGRLAMDAATKEINGKTYIRATVPQQDRRTPDGPTTWVDVMVPVTQNADGILGVLKKGAVVSASGDLKVRAYTANNGASKADVSLWAGRINIEKFADQEEEKPQGRPQEKDEDDGTDLPF